MTQAHPSRGPAAVAFGMADRQRGSSIFVDAQRRGSGWVGVGLAREAPFAVVPKNADEPARTPMDLPIRARQPNLDNLFGKPLSRDISCGNKCEAVRDRARSGRGVDQIGTASLSVIV